MKIRVIILCASTFSLLSCMASEQANRAKIYGDKLSTLLQRTEPEAEEQIIKGWGFELLDCWQAKDPSVETVIKNNFRTHGFSAPEAQPIFAAQGNYKVSIYLKSLGSQEHTLGKIDQFGLPVPESRQQISEKKYAYIRVVFRDGNLVHYQVW